MPANEENAVLAAVDQWFTVLNAMLNGDPEPLDALYSHSDDVTYMGAVGTYRIGWTATRADWKAQAAKSSGGSVEGADIHVVVNGDMATAAHNTIGSVWNADGEAVQTNVRETSVFRKEDGSWRMIGHHADTLADWEKGFSE